MSRLPAEKGTYVLLLYSPGEAHLQIGRLGQLALRKGWYAYVGSAFGPGGLRARLRHHLRVTEHPRWHLDYLRPHAQPQEIWYTNGPASREHRWAAALLTLPQVVVPLPGFGASDCTCVTHLTFFPTPPETRHFRSRVGDSVRRTSLR